MFNGSTHLDYTNYYEMLPSQRPGARALPRGRPDARPARHRGEPRQPDRGGQGGDPGQRAEPALRRVPVADPAAGDVRDLRQRPRRLRLLRRPGERHRSTTRRTSSTSTTPPATPCSRSPATSTSTRHRELVRAALRRRAQARRTSARPTSPSRPRPPSGAPSSTTTAAPAPAVALGWRVPDPADLDAYLPYVVLAEVLTDGDASRLRRRLVQDDRSATNVGGYLGFMGDAVRRPRPDRASCSRPTTRAEVPIDKVLAAVDEELDRLATDGLAGDELTRVTARLRSALLQGSDDVLRPGAGHGVLEQQRGRAELLNEHAGPARRGDRRAGRRGRRGAETRRPWPPRPDRRRCRMKSAAKRRERAAQPVPALTKPRKQRLPAVAERVLPTACASSPYAARRCRWSRCGCGCRSPRRRDADLARAGALLGRSMMLRHRRPLAERARPGPADDRRQPARRRGRRPDGHLRRRARRPGFGDLLGLLAEVLTDPAYPKSAVEREAGRLHDHVRRALSQPGVHRRRGVAAPALRRPPVRPPDPDARGDHGRARRAP